MQLLIVRHGIAVERGTPGIPDDDRPLTPEGEKKFKQAARGVARVLDKPYAILTSPLPRAHRTAELLSEAFGGVTLTATPALSEGSFQDLKSQLGDYPKKALLAVVGHEPFLSSLLAKLLRAKSAPALEFKKGGMALVELAGGLDDGGALLAFLPPRVLREID
jgi:phosphohistidine phosphatase